MKLTTAYEAKVYSQNGEDGIIKAILATLPASNRTFIEIGAGDATECNCRNLYEQGWQGVFIDAAFESPLVRKRFITLGNLQETLAELWPHATPPWVLSLDIDGNDWHVLGALGRFAPGGLLVCEFNGHFQHDELAVMPYDPDHKWAGTRYYGASLAAMHRLGNQLGYSLVYCNYVNMFLVQNCYSILFTDADSRLLYPPPWSHLPDERMSQMHNPWEQYDKS